jgi:hypothetical protein
MAATTTFSSATIDDVEELAYVRAEEARLRCERLGRAHRERWPTDGAVSSRVLEAHRQLGLAGFHAGAMIEPGVRQTRLGLAHLRSAERSDDVEQQIRALVQAVVNAAEAVEVAMLSHELPDHLRDAHRHMMRACEEVDAYLEAGLPTASAGH